VIAKQVAMNAVKQSDFGDLIRYLIGEQGKQERVGAVTVTNCESANPEFAILEVLNTQAQNTRSRSDKTFHLIVSFAPGEQLEDALIHEIERRICEGIGFGAHQRISVVHHDTDILHMHIAINKIHPTHYTIKEPFNVFHTLGKLCGQLESEFGLYVTNHASGKSLSDSRATDMEHLSAVQSLASWISSTCGGEIGEARSWTSLHRALAEHGLDLHARGNGLVFVDASGIGVKASTVHREYSKKRLEARLGPFEPSGEHQVRPPSAPTYDKRRPRSSINTDVLFAKYKEAQLASSTLRALESARVAERKKRLIEDAKRSGRLKRSAIKLMKSTGPVRKLLYALTSKTLRDEIADINEQYRRERHGIVNEHRRSTWADWLRTEAVEGNNEALVALRARGFRHGSESDTVTGKGDRQPADSSAAPDGVTKKGTIIYRAGNTAIRDDGNKLQVSRGADAAGLKIALQMAMERYGDRITVTGTDSFKAQIAAVAAAAQFPVSFHDAALERRRHELAQPDRTKEQQHEQQRAEQQRTDRIRPTRGDAPRSGAAGKRKHAGRNPAPEGARGGAKPNVGGIGKKPPPASQNRLRGLLELGVVHLADRGEVLLPGHVPGHMEQQGTAPDHSVRRHLAGPGLADTAASAAAAKYVLEREQRRVTLFDIPKHSQYTFDNELTAAFAGIRRVDGQLLALVKHSEEIVVVPIDNSTARRLKRVQIGAELTVGADGRIMAKKGRSR
jgi:hypothetical protein